MAKENWAEIDRRVIGQLHQIADQKRFTSTRVGDPGSPVRRQAEDDLWALELAISELTLAAEQRANP